MDITKIAVSSGVVLLAVAVAFAELHKPTFSTLTKVYYTNGGPTCPFIGVSTLQFTTNGAPGTGVQARISGKAMWGACSVGNGSHPAHFHF